MAKNNLTDKGQNSNSKETNVATHNELIDDLINPTNNDQVVDFIDNLHNSLFTGRPASTISPSASSGSASSVTKSKRISKRRRET